MLIIEGINEILASNGGLAVAGALMTIMSGQSLRNSSRRTPETAPGFLSFSIKSMKTS